GDHQRGPEHRQKAKRDRQYVVNPQATHDSRSRCLLLSGTGFYLSIDIKIKESNDIVPTSPTPLPVGERPTSRVSEMSGEGSYANSAPHPVCSLRSQTTLSPTGRGSESWLAPCHCFPEK